MKKEKRFKLWLEAHSDGGDASGAMEGSNDGFASQETQEAEVVYGIQDSDDYSTEQAQTTAEAQPETETDYKSFRERYKAEVDGEIRDAIQRRFRNSADFEAKFNSLSDSLAPLYSKYGLEYGDAEALTQAINDDTSLFEDQAYESGFNDPKAYMKALQDQKKLERYQQIEEQDQARRAAERDWGNWKSQEAELQKIYPNMSLADEMQNPKFATLLNKLGDVKTAYQALHADEIISGAIQKASAATKKAVTDNIAARGMRPSENGSRSSANVVYKTNVDDLTDKDLDAIIRQVKAGKKIRF